MSVENPRGHPPEHPPEHKPGHPPAAAALLRLRVTAEADLGALSRVLERFQNLNIVPRRVVAESGTGDILHIQVDVVGMSEERLTLITSKLEQALSILEARWHRV